MFWLAEWMWSCSKHEYYSNDITKSNFTLLPCSSRSVVLNTWCLLRSVKYSQICGTGYTICSIVLSERTIWNWIFRSNKKWINKWNISTQCSCILKYIHYLYKVDPLNEGITTFSDQIFLFTSFQLSDRGSVYVIICIALNSTLRAEDFEGWCNCLSPFAYFSKAGFPLARSDLLVLFPLSASILPRLADVISDADKGREKIR